MARPSGGLLPRYLGLDDRDGIALFRAALLRASFTSDKLQGLLNMPNAGAVPVLDIPVYLRRLRGDDPLTTLARLFMLHARVSESTARRALQPLEISRLAALGVVTVEAGQVYSAYNIIPFEGLYFLSDAFSPEFDAVPADHVTGVNPTSILLAFLTVRTPVERMLDLGTGNGVQALLGARHAKHVIATDINPRCLNVTAFNARLNGLDHVECRQGSFFEPVAGEQFDLIVSNPPYVVSPESRFIFRDGSRPGDAVCADIAGQMPRFLREGAFGHLLANWVCEPDGDWTDAPRRWLDGTGCDALALMHIFDDPLTYASRWLSGEYLAHPNEYGNALDRWLTYYEERGIAALASGALLMRRRDSTANWFQAFNVAAQTSSFCGDQLAQMFRIQDYCQRALPTDDALLNCRLHLRDAHSLEQTFERSEGRYQLRSSRLRLHEGQAFETGIDGFGVEVLQGCDGTRPLRAVIEDLAAKYRAQLAEILQGSLSSVRNLLVRGYLVPADLDAAD